MAPRKHVHKYCKIVIAGSKLWGCALPDCSHYMPRHLELMVNGKRSICWKCNQEFILDTALMQVDKPKCYDCTPGLSGIMDALEDIEIHKIVGASHTNQGDK